MTIELGADFWDAINANCREKVVEHKSAGNSAIDRELKLVGATDLYFWWAVYTDFRVSQPSGGGIPWNLPFIAEGDVVEFVKELSGTEPVQVHVPPEYLSAIGEGSAVPARYFTLNIGVPRRTGNHDASLGEQLDIETLKSTLRMVFSSPSIVRIQLGFPRGEFENEQTEDEKDKARAKENAADGAINSNVPKIKWSEVEPETIKRGEARVVVGVIDDGASFAHGSLRGEAINTTRVAILWSQSRELSGLNRTYWRLPLLAKRKGSGSTSGWYGAMMRAGQMNDAMKNAAGNGEVNEVACYASLFDASKKHRAMETRFRHGPAVLTTFAGAISASKVIPSQPDDLRVGVNNVVTDDCSGAPIVLVDLPYEHVAISSGRWMPIAALDGLRFILSEARVLYQTQDKKPVPVVVNISSGSTAGSHDGTSMFESALAELLKADPNLAVTIAAGNSRLSRVHSEVEIAAGASASLTFRVPPAKKFETYVEFWPERLMFSSDQGLPDASNLSFSVVAPDGRKIGPLVAGGNGAILTDAKGRTIAGMNYSENVVQACQRPMALLVIAATAPHPEHNHAPFGNWTVQCENKSNYVIRLRSWIERDEIVFGVLRPQSAHFTDPDSGRQPFNDWDEDRKYLVSRYDTTSNLARARRAFSVAASTGGRISGFVSPYSGGGSESGEWCPKLIARADRSPAQPGIPVFGAYGSVRHHMSGTSIAAPLAARWIANYMAAGHDRYAVQILADCSVPREHPHLVDSTTGKKRVASGEGKWFVDPNDPSVELCLGKPR